MEAIYSLRLHQLVLPQLVWKRKEKYLCITFTLQDLTVYNDSTPKLSFAVYFVQKAFRQI